MNRVQVERNRGEVWGRRYASWLERGVMSRDDFAAAVDSLHRMVENPDKNVQTFGAACIDTLERELVKRHMPTGEIIFSRHRVAKEVRRELAQ